MPGPPRQVLVLTDGEVSNTDEVIALGRRHVGHTRVFTFGIGAGASHHLVRGVARAGEGAAEFIAPGERIEAKVLRQLSRALTPALDEVGVDWGGLSAVQAPHEVPPVFADGRVLVFAKLENPGSTSVSLRAVGADGPVRFTLPIEIADAAEGTLVGTLWARRMIRDLEEGRSEMHPRRGSQQARALGVKDDKVKAAIVELGTAWSLVSRHTSFVAVEARETPTEGEAQLRKVPVAITRGWHGTASASMGVQFDMAMSDDADELVRFSERAPARARYQPAAPLLSRAFKRAGFLEQSTRPLDRLVALQRADGSWTLDDDLARALGWRGIQELRDAIGRPLPGDHEARAAATALALAWLEQECPDASDEWRILADKGREWLERTPEGVRAWLTVASEALASR